MALTAGTRLGLYEILAPIGAGGMGEVYRATDTKLDREVAIKVLPLSFAQDPERLARFEREAKILASLNHPNIAQIYGIEQLALVMELVPGESLRGPLSLEIALDYAKQIADAVEAAHDKGIVHRDLKPANIMITPAGVVKVLDFGLAALPKRDTPSREREAADPANSPTLTISPTRAGMILGTAAYMSPEQARGKTVDKRADIWAFGVVLFEMLTGKPLFEGETVSDTLAQVLTKQPDWEQVPAKVRRLLEACLQKDARQRLQAIGDWRLLLTDVQPQATAHSRSRLVWVLATVAAVATLALAALAFVHFREKPAVVQPMRLQVQLPESLKVWTIFSLSPDGRKLAFIGEYPGAGSRLWVHFLESGESRNLADAGGTPFWSPDSRFVAYPDKALMKIDPTGGPSQTIADFPPSFRGWGGGAWNQDDVILYGSRYIFRVPASGGVPVQITSLDPARHETFQWGPSFLPDGRHFLYTAVSTDAKKNTIYLDSIDAKPEQHTAKPLVASRWLGEYAPSSDPRTGYLLFVREDTLLAQSFDNRRLELKGQAVPVAEHIVDGRAFGVSANGTLVFQRTSDLSQRGPAQLTWYDRAGKAVGVVGEPGLYGEPVLSPDGKHLAVTKQTGTDMSDIWLLDLSPDGASTRFTFGSIKHEAPVWSPDGKSIIFPSNADGPYNLYQKPANGLKEETLLLKSSESKFPTSWSTDGRFLLYTVVDQKTKADIWVLPLAGNRNPVPFLITDFAEGDARFSPDGHWVAYDSTESGRIEVYVRSFSMNSAGTAVEAGGKWQISNGGGDNPRWGGDGRELFYSSLDGRRMAVEISTGSAFRAGNPQLLGPAFPGEWDFTRDGKRFLVAVPGSDKPAPFTVVLNWQAGLNK